MPCFEASLVDVIVALIGLAFYRIRFVAQYLHNSRALSGVGKYGVNSKHPMAAWERKKYGAGGPPNTNEDEKYMGLWHFDDLPSFEDATF